MYHKIVRKDKMLHKHMHDTPQCPIPIGCQEIKKLPLLHHQMVCGSYMINPPAGDADQACAAQRTAQKIGRVLLATGVCKLVQAT